MTKVRVVIKGGVGSGFHGHAGRPGKVGGSVPGKNGHAPAPAENPNIVNSHDELKSLPNGEKAYFILADGRLFDLYATQTNLYDHASVIAENPEVFGLNEEDAAALGGIKFDVTDEEAFDTVWSKIFDTGAIRVRETPGGSLARPGSRINIQSKNLDNKTLRFLQDRFGTSIRFGRNDWVYWSEDDPEGGYIEFDLDAFLSAKNIRELEAATVYEEKKETKVRVVLKGGKGSGFHGHAGRPGKVGGSAPKRLAGEVDSLDDLYWESGWGKGYFITGDDRIVDVGNTSHIDFIFQHPEDKEAYGLTDEDYEKMKKHSEDGDYDDMYNILGRSTGNLVRVRDSGRIMAINTNELDTPTLKRLQDLIGKKKIAPKHWQLVVWEPFTFLGTGEQNTIRTNLEELFDAERVVNGVLKEHTVRVVKGGPGSGHRGHAGRPGLVGGSTADDAPPPASAFLNAPEQLPKEPVDYHVARRMGELVNRFGIRCSVKVVDDLDDDIYGKGTGGLYDPKTKEVTFEKKYLERRPPRVPGVVPGDPRVLATTGTMGIDLAIAHEYGHAYLEQKATLTDKIHFDTLYNNYYERHSGTPFSPYFTNRETLISNYSTMNYHELFAESFAIYVHEPEWLEKTNPRIYEFIQYLEDGV